MATSKDDSLPLDAVGRQILRLLQEDARLPYSEIGRRVGLTAPAVAERVRRMEEMGIITGFHVAVNPAKLGLPIMAYLYVTAHHGRYDLARDFALQQSTLIECYCIAGDRDLLIKGVFESVEHMQQMVDQLMRYGSVNTTLVMATYLARRSLD